MKPATCGLCAFWGSVPILCPDQIGCAAKNGNALRCMVIFLCAHFVPILCPFCAHEKLGGLKMTIGHRAHMPHIVSYSLCGGQAPESRRSLSAGEYRLSARSGPLPPGVTNEVLCLRNGEVAIRGVPRSLCFGLLAHHMSQDGSIMSPCFPTPTYEPPEAHETLSCLFTGVNFRSASTSYGRKSASMSISASRSPLSEIANSTTDLVMVDSASGISLRP